MVILVVEAWLFNCQSEVFYAVLVAVRGRLSVGLLEVFTIFSL